jgi:hypothetical protein
MDPGLPGKMIVVVTDGINRDGPRPPLERAVAMDLR